MATDAFEQGKLAFAHNMPMSACEYPVSSSLRTEWMSGWTEARNAAPNAGHPAGGDHVGMMGDGTEEQNLGQPGDPAARISEQDVDAAFGRPKH